MRLAGLRSSHEALLSASTEANLVCSSTLRTYPLFDRGQIRYRSVIRESLAITTVT
jgi:hypothetical protein